MKNTLKTLLLLFSAAISISIALLSCDSYERKMARFEKVADEFKATLGPNNRIIAEQIDSVAQKVFYLVSEEGNKNIMMHDYSTNETKAILPKSGEIEDYEFCGIEILNTKLVKDRLFVSINSNCMWRLGATGVFYFDIRDNSLHYIESCDEASFRGNGEIAISKFYYLGEDEVNGREKTKREEYILSTSLSDERYAGYRWEHKRKEESLAEEWRKREEEEKRLAEERRRCGEERKIKIDYSLSTWTGYEDYAGTLQGRNWDNVYTKTIIVPNGKVWQLKNISYSGYSESNPPRFYYCKNENGSFDVGPEKLENGQILYPWGYTFWIILDKKQRDRGHRNVEFVFIEKDYNNRE